MKEKFQEAANKAGLDNLLQKKENGIHEMLMENGKNLFWRRATKDFHC